MNKWSICHRVNIQNRINNIKESILAIQMVIPRELGTSSDSIFMEMKTTTQLSKQNG